MKKFIATMAVAAFVLAGCSDYSSMGNKQLIGGGTGAVLGGLAGSQFGKGNGQLVGVGVGALLGTLVGSSIGQSLDKADLAYAQTAHQQAYSAPIGQSINWNNPQSGHSGTVTPLRDGRSTNGRYCREYSQTIYVDGKSETGKGTACQNSDGTWQIQNQ